MILLNKQTKQTSQPFKTNELMFMIDRMNENNRDLEMGILMTIGFYSGLRISDLLQIRWSDVLKDEFIVMEKKTSKNRKILVKGKFRQLIDFYYEKMKPYRTNDLIFLSPGYDDKPKSQQTLLKRFKRYSRLYTSLPLEYTSFHSLRKTFGKTLFDRNENKNGIILLLMEIFNHSKPCITRRYIGLREEEKNEVLDTLFFD